MPEHNAREVEHALTRKGFVLIRQRGSHRIFRQIATGRTTVIPFHGKNQTLKPSVFSSILRQTGLSKKDFS